MSTVFRSDKRQNERGSALFIIFVAIVLFAALGFAVSEMMRGGNPETLGSEKSRLLGDEILDYAQVLRRTVQTLRISNGCSDTEITFQYDEDNDGDYNDNDESYYNAGAPTDHSCHIFHIDGGGLTYIPPNTQFLDSSFSADALYGDWRFIGKSVEFEGVGTDGSGTASYDITAILPLITRQICLAINEKVHSVDGITEDSGSFGSVMNKYDGSFDSTGAQVINDAASAVDTVGEGLRAGCFCDDTDPTCPAGSPYYFYQILIAR